MSCVKEMMKIKYAFVIHPLMEIKIDEVEIFKSRK